MKAKGPYDLVWGDAPYGIGEDGRNNHTRSKLAKAKDYQATSRYDNESPPKAVFDHLISISDNQIFWGANHFISKIPYNSSCWIAWDKNNGDNDFDDVELAWTSFKTAARKFKWTWNGMLQENMKSKQYRIHPNEKPFQLFAWAMKEYGTSGMTVLDAFSGSMSAVISAINLSVEGFDVNINAYEKDPIHYASAKNRIQNHVQQLPLFGAPPIINFYE